MRNAIGAGQVFSICLAFILMFTAYLAISVNYANAFKFKNHIVSMIEENEGFNDNLQNEIYSYIEAGNYTARGNCPVFNKETDEKWVQIDNGIGKSADGRQLVCIYQVEGENLNKNTNISTPRRHYMVVTFFHFDLPVVNYFTTFKVMGQTRYFYDFANY